MRFAAALSLAIAILQFASPADADMPCLDDGQTTYQVVDRATPGYDSELLEHHTYVNRVRVGTNELGRPIFKEETTRVRVTGEVPHDGCGVFLVTRPGCNTGPRSARFLRPASGDEVATLEAELRKREWVAFKAETKRFLFFGSGVNRKSTLKVVFLAVLALGVVVFVVVRLRKSRRSSRD